MGKPRVSIAVLMGFVLVTAIGITALRSPSQAWADIMTLLMCGLLTLAVVGAICRRGTRRGWWLGFALFGWGYPLLVFSHSGADMWRALPTTVLLLPLKSTLGVADYETERGLEFEHVFRTGPEPPNSNDPYFRVGHCLWTLLFAVIGGSLGAKLFFASDGSPEAASAGPVPHLMGSEPLRRGPRPRARVPWVWAAGATGLALVVVIGTAVLRHASETWSALMFLLTYAVLLFAVLAAAGQRVGRGGWLGAALLGLSYMFITFHTPLYPGVWSSDRDLELRGLVTTRFLDSLRARTAFLQRIIPEPSKQERLKVAIRAALAQPMQPELADQNEVSLHEFCKFLKRITVSKRLPEGIPIWVDPAALARVGHTMDSSITLGSRWPSGVTVVTVLKTTLKQLDLGSIVDDGVVTITDAQSTLRLTRNASYDSFERVGHCVIAFLAASVGGLIGGFLIGAGSRRLTALPR